MAFPNLIGVLALSGVIFTETKILLDVLAQEKLAK